MGSKKQPESAHEDADQIRERIKHLLTVYPAISPTMLQAGLGPQTKPSKWRPLLQELVDEGVVKEETVQKMTPFGRHHSYSRLRLKSENHDNSART